MKRITRNDLFVFILLLTGMAVSKQAQAQCAPRTLPYVESFTSAPALPTCARSTDVDADGAAWVARTYAWTVGDGIPSLGVNAGGSQSHNWYYTPPLNLYKDSLYELNFIVRGHGKGAVALSLEVFWGADTTLPDSMRINPPLYNNPSLFFQYPVYDTVTAYFKPKRTTRHYIAFHDNTNIGAPYEMAINFMSVKKSERNSLTDVQIGDLINPSASKCPEANDSIRIAVINPGSYDALRIPVTVRFSGPATGIWHDTITGPLLAGESDTVTIRGIDLSAAGTYSFVGYTGLTGDDSRGNDTLRTTFEIKALPTADSIVATNTTDGSYIFTVVNAANISSYAWDFGDGSTSPDDIAAHTYAASGSYTVTLTVSNKCGEHTVMKTVEVTVPEEPGHIGFTNSEMKVTVFPNPASDVVYIKSKGTAQQITVYDGIGRMVYSVSDVYGDHTILTGSWISGLYTISILAAEGNQTSRLQLIK
jgi:hypothetical protein